MGLAPPRFRSRRTMGVWGLVPQFSPQRLELTHFVTGSVMLFVVFHAFRNLYTPPKTPYPISTLPEHLHSTSLSYAETTLNSRKLVSFPLIAHYLSAGPPPPFTGRPGHTHT